MGVVEVGEGVVARFCCVARDGFVVSMLCGFGCVLG